MTWKPSVPYWRTYYHVIWATRNRESLISSSIFVQTLEQRQGLKIACIEEIALAKGFIDEGQFQKLAEGCGKSEYGDYLWRVLKERQGPASR